MINAEEQTNELNSSINNSVLAKCSGPEEKLPTGSYPINLEYVKLLACLRNQTSFTSSNVICYINYLDTAYASDPSIKGSNLPSQQISNASDAAKGSFSQKGNNNNSMDTAEAKPRQHSKKKGRPKKYKKNAAVDENDSEDLSAYDDMDEELEENNEENCEKNSKLSNQTDFSCMSYTIIGNQLDLAQNKDTKSLINLTASRASLGSKYYREDTENCNDSFDNDQNTSKFGGSHRKTASNKKSQRSNTLDINKYFDDIYKGKRLPVFTETSLIQCFENNAQDNTSFGGRPSSAQLTPPLHLLAIYPSYISSIAHPSIGTASEEELQRSAINAKIMEKSIPAGKLCITCSARKSPYRCVHCEAAFCSIECGKKHDLMCLHRPYNK